MIKRKCLIHRFAYVLQRALSHLLKVARGHIMLHEYMAKCTKNLHTSGIQMLAIITIVYNYGNNSNNNIIIMVDYGLNACN